MANCVDPDQPVSEEAGLSGSTPFAKKPKYWFRKIKMINKVHYLLSMLIELIYWFNLLICDVTDKMVITSFSVNMQVDQDF